MTNQPPDWDRRRREVYRRDEYTCQNCHRSGGSEGDLELHAHHIVPKSKGGIHSKSNLVTVCRDCHDAIHNNSFAPTKSPPGDQPQFSDVLQSVFTQLLAIGKKYKEYKREISKLNQGKDTARRSEIEEELRAECIEAKSEFSNLDISRSSAEVRSEVGAEIREFIEESEDFMRNIVELTEAVDDLVKVAREKAICSNCDHEISDPVSYCPNCGNEISENQQYERGKEELTREVEEQLELCSGNVERMNEIMSGIVGF